MSAGQRTRRQAVVAGIALASAGIAGIWIATHPVQSGGTRLALIAVVTLAIGLVLWLAWPRRWMRGALVGGVGVLAAWIGLMPAHDVDPAALRAAYVRALLSLVDTPYVWGGEGRWGIVSSAVAGAMHWSTCRKGRWTPVGCAKR